MAETQPHRYLVGYSYGQGGLCALVRAVIRRRPTGQRGALLLLAYCIILVGCSRTQDQSGNAGRVKQKRLETDQVAADTGRSLMREPLRDLVARLAKLPGTFEKGMLGTWELQDAGETFEAISSHGDSAVFMLVDCLDDTTKASATMDHGVAVRVGYMCYAALNYTAYCEWDPLDYEHAKHRRWPGVLEPSANPEDLRAAKVAWKSVVSHKAYSLS